MSARSSSTVSNSEASEAHSSVTSGRTFSLTSLTSTWRCTGPSGARHRTPGCRPTRAPLELVVQLGQDRAAAELVEEVVGRHARRPVSPWRVPLQVDGQVVAVAGRPADRRSARRSCPAAGRSGRRSPRRSPPGWGPRPAGRRSRPDAAGVGPPRLRRRPPARLPDPR